MTLPAGLAVSPGNYVNGLVTTFTTSYLGNTYVRTITYTSGVVTNVSQWVKQ